MIRKILDYLFGVPVSISRASCENREMLVIWSNGKESLYVGSSTVWHELPLMKRCETDVEAMLSDAYEYIKYYDREFIKSEYD